MRFSILGFLSCFATVTLFAGSAGAATRTFKATLAKVPACSFASASGSATLRIDDVTGAVSGTLTVTGFDSGAVVSVAGIHNKNAGDNLVGSFDGVAVNAPNATHTVTTTLNAIALPKILAGDGVVIVKSTSGTGCTPGAVRGDMVEEGADGGTLPTTDAGPAIPTDAGTSPPPDAGTRPTTDAGTSPSTDAGTSPAPTPAKSDDGGCSHGGGPAPGPATAALGLLMAALAVVARRDRER